MAMTHFFYRVAVTDHGHTSYLLPQNRFGDHWGTERDAQIFPGTQEARLEARSRPAQVLKGSIVIEKCQIEVFDAEPL